MSSAIVVVVAIIIATTIGLSGNAAGRTIEDISVKIERLAGEPVRVVSVDALGFPERIGGLRAGSQYSARFDDLVDLLLDTEGRPKPPTQVKKTNNQSNYFFIAIFRIYAAIFSISSKKSRAVR